MGSERKPSEAAMPPGMPAQEPGFVPIHQGMATPRPSRSNVSVVSFNSRDIQLLAGLWQQVSSENLWQYSRTLGMGILRSYLSTWKYPTIQYSFPDEESFKVEINGTNVHQTLDATKDGTQVTTQTEHIFDLETNNEIIKTFTSGRHCGTIITTRSVNDDKELVWHSQIIDSNGTDSSPTVQCTRVFKKIEL